MNKLMRDINKHYPIFPYNHMEKYIKVQKDTEVNSIENNRSGIKIRFDLDMSIEEYVEFRKDGLDTKITEIKSLTIEFNTLSIQIIDPKDLRITRRHVRGNNNIDVTISIDCEYRNPNYTLTVGKMLMRDRILEGLI